MTTTTDGKEEKKTLSLSGKGTLSLKGVAAPAPRHQNVSPRGRGPTTSIAVEVRRSRAPKAPSAPGSDLHQLTSEEREARMRALRDAIAEDERRKIEEASRPVPEPALQAQTPVAAPVPPKTQAEIEMDLRQKELEELRQIEEEEKKKAEEAEKLRQDSAPPPDAIFRRPSAGDDEGEETFSARLKRQAKAAPAPRRTPEVGRRGGRITVSQAINNDFERDRGPSMAAQRRARERARLAALNREPQQKILRDVILPETITVQELANRMTERSADVIKCLMKMDVMATINQSIDADTAELVIGEFGHKVRRVTDSDVETGLEGIEDNPADMISRPPVVTIMGHVDHGKTSLLDALRHTAVASGEAGGITQHIGAYQVALDDGSRVTFLDTPGHAAFTEMRARGATVTDIVVLVVAADDSVMPQTIEAIHHARAANVPLIVAINKIDLPGANPTKIKNDLLQHEIVTEDMGGETLCVEVSAKNRIGLEKLVEAILLQAEVLDLRANPKRPAQGAVVESRLEKGRGPIATLLVEKGTLRTGDIIVAGAEWGKVRTLTNDRGENISEALPGQPVEVMGLQGVPESGDRLYVVGDEARAREVSEYRQRKRREAASAIATKSRTTIEQLVQQARDGEKQALPMVIKADVHGSVEALAGALGKLGEDNLEVGVKVLHTGIGGITESDVTLAKASKGVIVGFNVRATAQAREMAQRDGVDIRYYSIIYDVLDDARAILTGMLKPELREEFLGNAEIRQVFNITKVGKVAGCMIVAGMVKRGAKVRLLRDNVVIHEGTLKTLKRFKDEVKEVKEGMDCGMAFENYDDIREGDVIECFQITEHAKTLA
ncbi:MAG: translation initiation factor IF-2 [Rhodospirillales bacterium]|nr:translation initiation factor IF-2 [Rhodospirillales bacterium]